MNILKNPLHVYKNNVGIGLSPTIRPEYNLSVYGQTHTYGEVIIESDKSSIDFIMPPDNTNVQADVWSVENNLYGNGKYASETSSSFQGNFGYNVFTSDTEKVWQPNFNEDVYNRNTGIYEGVNVTQGIHYGAWLSIQMPTSVNVVKYVIKFASAIKPTDWKLLGFENQKWVEIDHRKDENIETLFLVNSDSYFSKFRFVFSRIQPNNNRETFQIGSIQLIGKVGRVRHVDIISDKFLINNSKLGINTLDPKSALDVHGDVTFGKQMLRTEENIVLGNKSGDYTDICEIETVDGGMMVQIDVLYDDKKTQGSKMYLIPINANMTQGTFKTLQPLSSTHIPFEEPNWYLQIKTISNRALFRVIQSSDMLTSEFVFFTCAFKISTAHGINAFTPLKLTGNQNLVNSPITPDFYESTGLTQKNGKIGVNTLNPEEHFHVNGKIKTSEQFLGFINDKANQPSFTWADDSNTGLFSGGEDTIGFSTNGIERMRLTNLGRVGIATVLPEETLHVNGKIKSDLQFIGTNDNAQYPSFSWANDSNTGIFNDTSNVIGFSTNGQEIMRGNSDGHIGIGTKSPVEKLHVNGKMFSTEQILGTTFDNQYRPSFSWENESNTGIYHKDSNIIGVSTGGKGVMEFNDLGATILNKLDVDGVPFYDHVNPTNSFASTTKIAQAYNVSNHKQKIFSPKSAHQGTSYTVLNSKGSLFQWESNGTTTNIQHGSLSGKIVTAVSSSPYFTMALDENGKIHAFGKSDYFGFFESEGTVVNDPILFEQGSLIGKRIVSISCGIEHTLALDIYGGVHAWGKGNVGQTGQGGDIFNWKAIPTKVEIDKVIVDIAAGAHHSLLLDSDGIMYSFGGNEYQCLATNTDVEFSFIPLLANEGSLANKKIISISAGLWSTFAIDSSYNVHVVGLNVFGTLGNGTKVNILTPTLISNVGSLNGKDIVSISTGTNKTVALDTTGKVHTWGSTHSSPMIKDELENIIAVNVHSSNLIALDNVGYIYVWKNDEMPFKYGNINSSIEFGFKEAEKLVITGNVQALGQFVGNPDDSSTKPSFTWNENSNTGLFYSATNSGLGLSSSGKEFMRGIGNGFVGIGLENPTENLHVHGKIKTNDQVLGTSLDSQSKPSFTWDNDQDTGMYNVQQDTIGFTTGGNEFMRGTNTGYVAIGHQLPTERLHVDGKIRTNNQFIGEFNDSSLNPSYTWNADSNTGIFSAKKHAIGFSINGNEFMRGTEVGNLAIGMTHADERLHVKGNIKATNQYFGSTTDEKYKPSYSWTESSNTGMFHPRNNEIGFSANGDEVVNITQNGLDVLRDCHVKSNLVVNQVLASTNGTQENPVLSWNDDTDTGFYRSVDNEIALTTAGTKKLSIDDVGQTNIFGYGLNVGSNTFIQSAKSNHVIFIYTNGEKVKTMISTNEPIVGSVLFEVLVPLYVHLVLVGGGGDSISLPAGGGGLTTSVILLEPNVIYKLTQASNNENSTFEKQVEGVFVPLHIAKSGSGDGSGGFGETKKGGDGDENGPFVDIKFQIDGVIPSQVGGGGYGLGNGDIGRGGANGTSGNPGLAAVSIQYPTSMYIKGNTVVEKLIVTAQTVFDGDLNIEKQILASQDYQSKPTFSWASDSNTGIFNASPNVIGFSTGGKEFMRGLENGYVSIGTTNATERLHVEGKIRNREQYISDHDDATKPSFSWTNDSNTGMFNATSNVIGFSTNGIEAFRVIGNGNVGIGIESPTETLHVNGKIRTSEQFLANSNDNMTLPSFTWDNNSNTGLYNASNNTIAFTNGGIESVRIDHNGDVGIGTTTPADKLHVNGGVVINGELSQSSDARLKTNITPLQQSLQKLLQINGYTYNRRDHKELNVSENDVFIGLIAQEVQKIIPEAVNHDKENDVYTIKYINMIAMLIESIKTLHEKVATLEQHLFSTQ